jgi:hypothetical protein
MMSKLFAEGRCAVGGNDFVADAFGKLRDQIEKIFLVVDRQQ